MAAGAAASKDWRLAPAIGTNKYLVRFDNGEEKECASSLLKKERSNASLPPDMPINATPAANENAAEDNVEAEIRMRRSTCQIPPLTVTMKK